MRTGKWLVGELELDRSTFSLSRRGTRLKLDPKPLELLLFLADRHGAVVSHDEALRHVWGEGIFIDGESALYTAVKKIRQALGEYAGILQTVSGRGYRVLVDPHEPVALESDSPLRRLAVLPFVNLSTEPESDYFSAGLTEELIGTLAKLLRGHLNLIARTSAMRFKDTTQTAQQIAQNLGVQYLLQGSVRRQHQRVRVAVHLLHGADGVALWSETFERDTTHMFSLQREISVAVAAATRTSITPENPGPAARPVDPQVRDLELRARFLYAQRTPPAIQTAIRLFREALALDHSYAPPYAGLSCCYSILPITSLARPHETFPQAKSLAEQAIRLDPTQSEAYIVARP